MMDDYNIQHELKKEKIFYHANMLIQETYYEQKTNKR
jgi:hypothetical protein